MSKLLFDGTVNETINGAYSRSFYHGRKRQVLTSFHVQCTASESTELYVQSTASESYDDESGLRKPDEIVLDRQLSKLVQTGLSVGLDLT